MKLLVYDPPKAEKEDFKSCSFEDLKGLDLVCVCTPYIKSGKYPTKNMLNKKFFESQNKDCILISVGRGEVIDMKKLF